LEELLLWMDLAILVEEEEEEEEVEGSSAVTEIGGVG
jgi:hypothetical protein